jgi:hypothetical protein
MQDGPHSTARSSCVWASMKPGALAGGYDFLRGADGAEVADLDDAIAGDADVGLEARRAGAVEHRRVTDDQIAA